MAAHTFPETPIERDAQGFLCRVEDWNPQIAERIAREIGIEHLSERHWQVVSSLRRAFLQRGTMPWLRMLSRVSGVSIQELYRLFPTGPSARVAKIAGIPKQRACI